MADARHAVRLLARSPLFAFTSILSLAVGVAAAAAIFSLADALLLRASPGVRDAARVVDIARTTHGAGYGTLSYPAFRFLRDHTQTLQSMAATGQTPSPLSLIAGTASERVYAQTVSGNFFEVLGVRPSAGRFFHADEDRVAGARPVVVLSHRFWRQRFEGDASVVGRSLRLNGTSFTVVGVAEAGFDGETIVGTHVWVPMAMAGLVRGQDSAALLDDPAETWHRAIGRLAPGATREEAQAELDTLFRSFRSATPSVPAEHGVRVASAGRLLPHIRARFGAFIGLLFAFAAGLLAIACSNVGGMLLARATVRHREMATRLAMGASRARLVGQLLVETLVLFLAAGVAAVPLVFGLIGAFDAVLPALPLPIHLDLAVNARSLSFIGGTALLAGVLFGLAPAGQALKSDVSQALHGRSATAGRNKARLRQGLVVAQVAVALAMMTTAGLFVRTLQATSRIDRGYDTADVEIVTLDTTLAGASGAAAVALMDRVAGRLRAIGGVEAVGHARMIPLHSGSLRLGTAKVPGADDAANAQLGSADWNVISPDYLRAVGLTLIEGRDFSSADRDGAPAAAIVNQTFARLAWPGQPAIGRQVVQVGGPADGERVLQIVGVAQDARYQTSTEPQRPHVYVPFQQQPQAHVELFVRHAPGLAIAAEARAAIAAVDPRLPIVMMRSFDEAVEGEFFPQRLAAGTAGAAGAIGVFLSALGLYGLVAFLVAQRTREIAIRMALGASHGAVRSMVLRQAATLGGAGGLAGLALAMGLGLLVRGLLVGVPPADPITFGVFGLLMAIVLAAASYIPARRASRTDPAAALRAE